MSSSMGKFDQRAAHNNNRISSNLAFSEKHTASQKGKKSTRSFHTSYAAVFLFL